MIKEELEKEAYLYAKNSKDVQNFECGFDIAFKSYLAAAEPREKEIHTWKEASENNSYKAFQLQEENKTLSKHVLELKATNKKISDENVELIGKVAFLENDLNNAKAQIEKLKCCYNCEHGQNECYCNIKHSDICDLSCWDKGCEDWQLRR